jgi:hypothetical protein
MRNSEKFVERLVQMMEVMNGRVKPSRDYKELLKMELIEMLEAAVEERVRSRFDDDGR